MDLKPECPGLNSYHARAFKTIEALAGHWQNGTDVTVRIYQDDATQEWVVSAGKKSFYGRSLMSALISAQEAIDAQI